MNTKNQYRLDQVIFWMSATFYLNGELFLFGLCLTYLFFQTIEKMNEHFSIARMVCLCSLSFLMIYLRLSLSPIFWIWIVLHSAWLESYQREDFYFYFPFYIGFVLLALIFKGMDGTMAWIHLFFLPGLLISSVRKSILKGKTQKPLTMTF
ncbi:MULTISPECIES: hypothetical protein [Terrabacteria group]|uniref:hypothetical protein n=1 Tax=Bacillati TaxID=1783272 RepID=UPI001C6E671A|nr:MULTISPECIES: hypothetical protein [Terrabacteria group]MBW9212024.1 hypothetical protein [Trueperella sp. zg.1013]